MGISNSNLRNPSVAGTTYLGCYTDLSGNPNGSRILADAYVNSYDMSVEKCAVAMSSYKYFGLEYANECFGANTLSPLAKATSAAMCDFECVGAMDEACGAAYSINVYENKAPAALPQCSLIVTSYVNQFTATQSPITVTNAATTVTVTTTTTSTAPTTTVSSAPVEFYLYSNGTNQYLTTGLGFADVPDGSFHLDGTKLLISSSMAPLGVSLEFADYLVLPVAMDPSLQAFEPLNCSRNPLTEAVSCTAACDARYCHQGQTFSEFASCVETGIDITIEGTQFLFIDPATRGGEFICSDLNFVAIPVAVYQPHKPDPTAPQFYLETTNPTTNTPLYVSSSGQLTASPSQTFSFSGRVMFPANSTSPMYGQGIAEIVDTIGSGPAFTQPIACSDNAGVLSCDAGSAVNQMSICSGSLGITNANYKSDYSSLPSCRGATYKLIYVDSSKSTTSTPRISPTSSSSTSSTSALSPTPALSGYYIYCNNTNLFVADDGAANFGFSTGPTTTFNLQGNQLASSGHGLIGTDNTFYNYGYGYTPLVPGGNHDFVSCTISASSAVSCTAGAFSTLVSCQSDDVPGVLSTPELYVTNPLEQITANNDFYCTPIQLTAISAAAYRSTPPAPLASPAHTFYVQLANFPGQYLGADGKTTTTLQPFYISDFGLFAVGATEPFAVQSAALFRSTTGSPMGAGAAYPLRISCRLGLDDSTVICDEGFGQRFIAVCRTNEVWSVTLSFLSTGSAAGCTLSALNVVKIIK